MAKQRSLAEASKGVVTKVRGCETWDVLLRQANPTRMAEIDLWLDQWEGGECRETFQTPNSIALFIVKNSEGLVKNAPPVIKYMQRRAANGKPRRSK